MGVPVPSEGLVDIPIVEKEVQSHQSHYKVGELTPIDTSPLFPLLLVCRGVSLDLPSPSGSDDAGTKLSPVF